MNLRFDYLFRQGPVKDNHPMLAGKLPTLILFILLISFCGCERPTDFNQTDNGVPPAVPTGLIVYYANDAQVFIIWHNNVEPDLKGYNVYRSTDSVNFSLLAFTTDNSYFDDTLNYTTTYYYRVTSLDIWNTESKPSDVVSAKPVNKYVPFTPKGLAINARNFSGQKSVYLTWLPNNEGDIAGYKIYRSTKATFTADTAAYIGIAAGINYTDTLNLSLYTEYYYKIKALDKGGLQSDESQTVNDEIYDVPELIFPQDNAQIPYFNNFLIKAIKLPAHYKLIIQDNQFSGEVWSYDFTTSTANDTLSIPLAASGISFNTTYYWRVLTYSNNGSSPNSVSNLYKFIIKQ